MGAFVLAGLALLGLAVFLLGDFTFERRYTLYVLFDDTAGLSEKAPVKLSGVEVGKVKAIRLEGRKAKVETAIRRGVPIYRDAVFSIGSTGIIGSKFLQVDQGSESAGLLRDGDMVEGQDPVSIEKALTGALSRLEDLLGDLAGDSERPGPLARNLNATVDNLRSLTANLDEMFADTKPHLTSAMARLDGVSAKLDSLLAKADRTMSAVNEGKGPVGALIHDQKMKEQIQETVSSVKETAGTVKDVLGRMNQFRIFWNYDWRYAHAIDGSRADLGLRIQPRPGRYYYLGGANLGNEADRREPGDYERRNTVDALLGFRWLRGAVDLGVGVLRSAGGGRLTVTPMPEHPVLGRFSATAQAYAFGRDRVINGRRFDSPQYDVGGMIRLHRLVGVGARVEDLAEVPRYQSWVNVSFEDKDVAYLFGLVSFASAGTRARSRSD